MRLSAALSIGRHPTLVSIPPSFPPLGGEDRPAAETTLEMRTTEAQRCYRRWNALSSGPA